VSRGEEGTGRTHQGGRRVLRWGEVHFPSRLAPFSSCSQRHASGVLTNAAEEGKLVMWHTFFLGWRSTGLCAQNGSEAFFPDGGTHREGQEGLRSCEVPPRGGVESTRWR